MNNVLDDYIHDDAKIVINCNCMLTKYIPFFKDVDKSYLTRCFLPPPKLAINI